MDVKKLGMIAASSVALLAGSAASLQAGAKVVDGHFCQNNSCDGKSACAGAGNPSCAGQNKGHTGWLKFEDKAACEKNGGKWADAKALDAKATPHKK